MRFLSEILLVCRCLRGVDRHYRPRMPASGAEKAFTVSHISAQLFSSIPSEKTGNAGSIAKNIQIGLAHHDMTEQLPPDSGRLRLSAK